MLKVYRFTGIEQKRLACGGAGKSGAFTLKQANNSLRILIVPADMEKRSFEILRDISVEIEELDNWLCSWVLIVMIGWKHKVQRQDWKVSSPGLDVNFVWKRPLKHGVLPSLTSHPGYGIYYHRSRYKYSYPRQEDKTGFIYHACVHAKLLQLCPTVCNPMDGSQPHSSVHEISQARRVAWVAMASTRASSQPRDWTSFFYVYCIGRRVLHH